jgi:hypothetical protein
MFRSIDMAGCAMSSEFIRPQVLFLIELCAESCVVADSGQPVIFFLRLVSRQHKKVQIPIHALARSMIHLLSSNYLVVVVGAIREAVACVNDQR